MGTDQENGSTRLQTLAAIATILAFLWAVVTWYVDRKPSEAQIEPRPTDSAPAPTPDEPSEPTPQTTPAPEVPPPAPQAPPRAGGNGSTRAPTTSIEVLLQNGEQQTVLADQVALAAEFSQIGSEKIVTVRINTPGNPPASHAVLGAGERFGFALDGKDYFVYVLRVDPVQETVKLRVARAS